MSKFIILVKSCPFTTGLPSPSVPSVPYAESCKTSALSFGIIEDIPRVDEFLLIPDFHGLDLPRARCTWSSRAPPVLLNRRKQRKPRNDAKKKAGVAGRTATSAVVFFCSVFSRGRGLEVRLQLAEHGRLAHGAGQLLGDFAVLEQQQCRD